MKKRKETEKQVYFDDQHEKCINEWGWVSPKKEVSEYLRDKVNFHMFICLGPGNYQTPMRVNKT